VYIAESIDINPAFKEIIRQYEESG